MADRKGKLLDLRFYGEISGAYDLGLTPVSIDPQGHLAGGADGGLDARTGVSVSGQWNHAKLSIKYRGVSRQYADSTFFNGLDQFLNLAYSHLLQPHVTLDLKKTLGTTTLANGAFSCVLLTNTDLIAVPGNLKHADRFRGRLCRSWRHVACRSARTGATGYAIASAGSPQDPDISARREAENSTTVWRINSSSPRWNVRQKISRRASLDSSGRLVHSVCQRLMQFLGKIFTRL
jgi:hypothetical protein